METPIENIKGRNENGPKVGGEIENVLCISLKVALESDYEMIGNDCSDLKDSDEGQNTASGITNEKQATVTKGKRSF